MLKGVYELAIDREREVDVGRECIISSHNIDKYAVYGYSVTGESVLEIIGCTGAPSRIMPSASIGIVLIWFSKAACASRTLLPSPRVGDS